MNRWKWVCLMAGMASLLLFVAISAGAREAPDPDEAISGVTPTGQPSTETPAAPPETSGTPATETEPVEGTVAVDPSLRVRASPWGRVIGGLLDGAKVTVIGQEGDFYKISWGGGTAFVHKNYVSVPGRPATQEPVSPPANPPASPPQAGEPPKDPQTPGNVPSGPAPSGKTVGATQGDGSAKGALNWALDQLPGGTQNGLNSNNQQTTKSSGAAWNNWCLAFVATAWGRKVPELKAYSAILAYNNCKAAGKIVNDRNPPAGAPMFQDKTGSNEWGHIFIATGEKTADGDPIIVTTGWPGYNGIHRITLSEMESKYHAKYLGWAKVP